MLMDKEGNEINLVLKQNQHIKVLGRSGSGKTYWCCRYMEEAKVPIVVLDFSGSYTEEELQKAKFNSDMNIRHLNLKKETISITTGRTMEEVVENITDSLIATFKISAMTQRRLLEDACESIIETEDCFSFKALYEKLTEFFDETEDEYCRKQLDHLMNKVYHLKKLEFPKFEKGETVGVYNGVTILQLSDFKERTCKSMAQFILELEWRKIYHMEKRVPKQIVLDEIQLLQVSGTAIEEMLREGRRYELGLFIMTQFAPSTEDIHILEQAATSFYFKPNEKQIVSTARLIDAENYNSWISVLKNLDRGEAVLTGNYTVNGHKNIAQAPIIVEVNAKG